MTKIRTIIISIASFFVFIASIFAFFLWWYIGGAYIKYAEKTAMPLIVKIENYKEINGKTPDSFVDLGFTPDDFWGGMRIERKGIAYWYEKISDTEYLVYFDLSVGESLYYHSYTKEWDIN